MENPTNDNLVRMPDRQDLVSHARSLIPLLRQNAVECEKQRRVPDANFEAMRSSGLLNVCKPKAYGGYELGWDVLCEIAMELAKGCGSSGWVYAVLAEHNHTAATYSLEAQHDIWADNPETLVASGNAPQARLDATNGGWLVTTRFNFSSGCDFADWHLSGTSIDGKMHKILLPQADCTVVDNWHVMGLQGTGSKDIAIERVFLPYHRTMPVAARGPWFDTAAVFRVPQWSVCPYSLASVLIGAAEGALENFVEDTKSRMSRFGPKIAEFQSLQLRIAESASDLRAARLIVLENLRETMQHLEHYDELPIEIRARNKRDMAYVSNLAIKAIDRIMYASGATGLFLSNDIQRAFRDIHAGANQIALNWDVNGTTYGKVALGIDPNPVRW